MQDALADLYQEVILDHGRKPRNFRRLEQPTVQARGDNPMCGDRVDVFLQLDGASIADVCFHGRGCAVSLASASMMTEAVAGLSNADAMAMAARFQEMARTGEVPAMAGFKRLAVLAGVHEFPSRVKCATLPWVALQAAIALSGDGAKETKSE